MCTHPLPAPAARSPVRTLVGALLIGGAVSGCLRNPSADVATAQALSEIADQLGAMQQDNAALQNQVDSLRAVVARQDSVLRRVANLAGVPVPWVEGSATSIGAVSRSAPREHRAWMAFNPTRVAPSVASMRITIEYCTLWSYEPRATRLAAEVEQRFPEATVELIPSSGGRFEVIADGKAVFEKSKLRRHAEPGEVVAALERLKRPA